VAAHSDQLRIQADPVESGNRARPGERGQQHMHVRHPAGDDRINPAGRPAGLSPGRGPSSGATTSLWSIAATAYPWPARCVVK